MKLKILIVAAMTAAFAAQAFGAATVSTHLSNSIVSAKADTNTFEKKKKKKKKKKHMVSEEQLDIL